MRPRFALRLLLALLPIVVPSRALAAWPPTNQLVCGATGDQTAIISVPDGLGGAFYVWTDLRAGNQDVYAQRVDGTGNLLWAPGGLPVCVSAGDQRKAVVLADGSGGAFITWMDMRAGNFDVYVQRISAAGTPLYAVNGVAIATGTGNQDDPEIVTDGAGGAIIAWEDARSGVDDIYAQRINGAGTPQWAANGVALCTAVQFQTDPVGAPDGAGGAIFAWQDDRGGAGTDDVYARRINAAGVPQWAANGVAISAAANEQSDPVMVADGAGGAYIVWQDGRSGTGDDVYAQRVGNAGVVAWAANGVAVGSGVGDQLVPAVVGNGASGVFIAWQDDRSGIEDVYAQRLNSSGVAQWTANGRAVCTATGAQLEPEVAADGAGGILVTWQDARSGTDDVYVQRLNVSGVPQWAANGAAVSTATGAQQLVQIVPDGFGGAMIGWQDARTGGFDVYAQRVTGRGTVEAPNVELEDGLWLAAPQPNPMRSTGVTFRFALPRPMPVTIAIFDPLGRRVRVLEHGMREAGPGVTSWDGADEAGTRVAAGVYFVRLESPAGAHASRIVVMD